MITIKVISRTPDKVFIKINNKPATYIKKFDYIDTDYKLTNEESRAMLWFCKRATLAQSCVLDGNFSDNYKQ